MYFNAFNKITTIISKPFLILGHVFCRDTDGWYHTCRVNPEKMWKNKLCRLGIPWPNNLNHKQREKIPATDDGWLHNCWVNEKVDNYLVPRLEDQLTIKQRLLATQGKEK